MWSRSGKRSAGKAVGVLSVSFAMVLGTSTTATGAPGDAAAPQAPVSAADEYIVAFDGAPETAAAAIAAAGGTVTDLTEQVGVALVTSTDGTFLDDVRARGQIRGAARNHSVGTARPGMPHRFASLLPVTVISEMLGVPVAMREQFLAWGDRAAPVLDMGLDWSTHRDVERSLAELDAWWRGHLQQLRRDPGADLLSALVTTVDDDGGGLTETELRATAALVVGAGFETTVNLIGNGAALLFDHPDQRRLLAEDPSLWPNAVDEVLRVDPPVQRTGRRARRSTTVHGVPVAEGEWLILLLAAADRDPQVFPDPHVFDVTRPNARDHLAFGSGIHFCLGAALARMEGEVALQALFERFPDLGPAGPGRRRGTVILRGHESLPVVLGSPTARARSALGASRRDQEPVGPGPARAGGTAAAVPPS